MRTEGWPERLAEAIEAAQKKTFAYGGGEGKQDCCLFAADVVLAMTGFDYAAELRGYESKQDAYRIVARYGSLEAMATALLGAEPVHPAFAHRGDVVLADFEDNETMGICLGAVCAFPSQENGLVMLPRSVARLAWRVE